MSCSLESEKANQSSKNLGCVPVVAVAHIGKTLREVMPFELSGSGTYSDTKAFRFLDVKITAEHSGDTDNRRWLGKHKYVYVWYELENGYAVTWNENPVSGWSFPVIKIK